MIMGSKKERSIYNHVIKKGEGQSCGESCKRGDLLGFEFSSCKRGIAPT